MSRTRIEVPDNEPYVLSASRKARYTVRKPGKGVLVISETGDADNVKDTVEHTVAGADTAGTKIEINKDIPTYIRATGEGWVVIVDDGVGDESTSILMAPSPQVNSTGNFRVAFDFNTYQDIQIDFLDQTNWESLLVGAGAIAHNATTPFTDLSVGATLNDRASNQTSRYFPYSPGDVNQIKMTGVFAPAEDGLIQEWMYGDENDAIGLRLNGIQGIEFFIRSSTTGTPVEQRFNQTGLGVGITGKWNGDLLDGFGPSGEVYNPLKSQLFAFDFLYLGVGPVHFNFVIDDAPILCHTANHANIISTMYLATPRLPIQYNIQRDIAGAGTVTMEQGCVSIASEGGSAIPGRRLSTESLFANNRTSGGTKAPFMAIRLAPTVNGKPNRQTVQILDVHVRAATRDTIIEINHVHHPSAIVPGAQGWLDIGPTGVQWAPDIISYVGAPNHIVDGEFLPAGGSVKAAATVLDAARFIDSHAFLSQDRVSTNSQLFALTAETTGGAGDILGAFTFLIF